MNTHRLDPARGHDGDLANRFTYHPPTPEQPEVYQAVRDMAHLLALLVTHATPPSREQSLALTHLEETVMWANAGIARRGLTHLAQDGVTDLLDTAVRSLRTAKPYSHVLPPLVPTADWTQP